MRITEDQKLILGPPGCVDADTEYLSPEGWVKISEYTEGKVCQYHLDSHTASWVEPIAYINEPCYEMLHISTKYGLDQMVSFGHRVLWYSKYKGSETGPFTTPAIDVFNESRRIKYPVINIPSTVIPPGGKGIDLTDEQIRVMVAVIADGTFNKDRDGKSCCIRIKKERKKLRLTELLISANIEFKSNIIPCEESSGFVRFGFKAPLRMKSFGSYWWGCSISQLKIIADELVYWDGSFRKINAEQFSTTIKESADFAQYAYLAAGKTARLRTIIRSDNSIEYEVYASTKTKLGIFGGTVNLNNIKIVNAPNGRQYCFEVPSSYLLLRRNGCIFITGNTGKTTYVINEIESLMDKGVAPDRIAFVSFTKKAIGEAVHRATNRFNIKQSQLPLFKTIHSLCFAGLGIGKKDVMGRDQYRELGDWLGYKFEGTWDESEGVPVGSELGDTLLFLDNLARITNRPLKQVWEENYHECEWDELERFQDCYQDFKSAHSLMDFTDMLYGYVAMCDPSNAQYVFVDEAQDLSAAQWMVLKHAFGGVIQASIAGDDDQSIYKWSGADVNTFLELEGEQTVLSHSYRLPRTIHGLATKLVSNIEHRFDKPFVPRDAEGNVDFFPLLDYTEIDNNQSTMILVRNTYLQRGAVDHLQRLGIPYFNKGWSSLKKAHVNAIYAVEKLRKHESITAAQAKEMYEHMRVGHYLKHGFKTKIALLADTEMVDYTRLNQNFGLTDLAVWYNMLEGINNRTLDYYRAVLANGYTLTATPKCSVSTIHAAKGGEADHVILMSDMAQRSYREYEKSPDDERRVAYVGATRAKEKLSIILPQSKYAFSYYNEGME